MKQAIESLLTRARGLFHKPESKRGEVTILGLLADAADRDLLSAAAARNQWSISFAHSYEESRDSLEKKQAAIVLCDRDLVQPDWGLAVQSLAACSPGACILLVSKVADEYLWNEVVRCGGYDILSKPLQEAEVERAVKLACTYFYARIPFRTAYKTNSGKL
jgi:DNA-binding NtrC family response regulator